MRILLIEDEKKTAAFLAKGLREEGHTVDRAPDGEAGLELAGTKRCGVMRLRSHFRNRLIPAATSFGFLAFLAINHSIQAQTAVSEHVVVTDEEVPSAYGAPPSFSRSRFANLTNAYVLPPWAVYAGIIYEGDALRFNSPDHTFTQEIEIGLPYRFGVAMENSVERFRGYTQDRSFSLEVRYALADWNKIPLNPTLFAEYKFGIGNILHDEGPPMPLGPGEALAFINEHNPLPDAYELRLLLSQDFSEKIEWALNAFFEQEIGGDRGREYGFAQSAVVPVLLPREQLKVGVEMQLSTFTDAGSRGSPSYRFIIGPTIAWKPTKNTRLDISPLFGATDDAPRASVFVVFSMLFGPPGAHETEQGEAPASTRNR